MNLISMISTISVLTFVSCINGDVCSNKICTCNNKTKLVTCDNKGWANLNGTEFPSYVVTLTLNYNQLQFTTSDDRSKIENLPSLTDLSLNNNPINTIPLFNGSKIKSLSLQDAVLTSAEFPVTYTSSFLQKISLSNNKIQTIKETDFKYLTNSKVTSLYIDGNGLEKIDLHGFSPLQGLQSLSLQNNKLKSCDFLPTLPFLSSIKLDGNQFTSLPQELSTPKKIKTYSFTLNSISVIDEASPLNTWQKMNYTNIYIYLANNSFDCCQSTWFIQFLKVSKKFVPDALLLTCAKPSNYAGKLLISLNPDDMHCGGVPPDESWWTTGRIIGITVGGLISILSVIFAAFIFIRQRRSRSGYTEIGGIDEPTPTAPVLPSNELPFPPYGEDNNNDDVMSSYSTAFTRNTTQSQAPTHVTVDGVSVVDSNRV